MHHNSPFFKLFADDARVVDSFIDAVSEGAFDSAKALTSKTIKMTCTLDYGRLRDAFLESGKRVRLSGELSSGCPANVRPSMFLLQGESDSILQVYARFEPDRTSDWKICGLELTVLGGM